MALVASRSSSRMLAILAMVATTALWGVSYPLIKQLVDTIPPCTLAVLRLAIALAVLIPVLLVQGRRPRIGRAALWLGLTGVGAFQLLQNYGMAQMPAGTAVIVLFGSSVALTTGLGRVVLGEPCSTAMAMALLGCLAGVGLVARETGGGTTFPLTGLLLIVAAALAFSIYAVLGRQSLECDMSELNAGALVVGLLALLPFAIWERPNPQTMPVGGDQVLALVLLGALVTAGTYTLWSFGIRHLQASEASVFCAIEPAFGLLFAWMLLRESVSPQQIVGVAIIVASCVLMTRRPSTGTPAPEAAATEPDSQGVPGMVAL